MTNAIVQSIADEYNDDDEDNVVVSTADCTEENCWCTSECVYLEEGDCSTFDLRVDNVLDSEGGYVNNPDDKGGPTNRGIAWATWQENARSVLGVDPTLSNLQSLTEEGAKKIYEKKYWDRSGGYDINDGDIRYFMFDFYVNSGGWAVKTLQKSLNELNGISLVVDGAIGPNTLMAVNSSNSVELYNKLKEKRLDFYEKIVENDPTQEQFLEGWKNRLDEFEDKSETNSENVNCE